MRVFPALTLLLCASACSNGTVPCPAATNSSGVCVPALSPWCALQLYMNPYAAPAARVSDLLSRLTLQEKVNLLQTTPANSSAVPRLGVPQTTTAECLHGYVAASPSTLFPQSISLAASFDAGLVREVAAAVGVEARAWRNAWSARGNASAPPPSLTCFAPQINIVRDSRWGRGQETYGESPALTQALAHAYVAGLQRGNGSSGAGGASPVFGPYDLAHATTKHFLAYQGASTRGQPSPTEVFLSIHDMIETYEPGWRGALEAGTAGVMCAYSSLCHDDTNTTCAAQYGPSHGVPMCANAEMTGWLRGGGDGAAPGQAWNGTVIGDCGAVQFIETDHHWAANQSAAAAAALNSGTDVDCSISVGRGFAALPNATAEGLTTLAAIDAALGRLLLNQVRLGYYEPPGFVPWERIPMAAVNSPAHRALALRAARESLVLLANSQGALPLSASALRAPGALLVTGPNAQLVPSGNYASTTDVNVTAWAGLAAALPQGAAVLAPGCASVGGNDTTGFAAALAAARAASAIVAVMGLDGTQEYEDNTRTSLALPGVQEQFLRALLAAARAARGGRGAPVVLVLMGGSAVAPSREVLAGVAGVVWAGYAGEEAGSALAGALLGAFSPGGRMPFTSYASAEDLPPYANMSMVGLPHGRTYRYWTGPEPVWRFGDGGSYGAMAYSGLASAPPAGAGLRPCQALTLSVLLANAGAVDGDEVVQAYVRLLDSGAEQAPRLALAAFARVSVRAGAPATRVALVLPPRALAVVNASARAWEQRPARVQVFVGGAQPRSEAEWAGPQAVELALRGPVTRISDCPAAAQRGVYAA